MNGDLGVTGTAEGRSATKGDLRANTGIADVVGAAGATEAAGIWVVLGQDKNTLTEYLLEKRKTIPFVND